MRDVDDEDILGDLIAQGSPTREVDEAVGALLTEDEPVAAEDEPTRSEPQVDEARLRLAAQHEANRARAEQAAAKAEQDAAAADVAYQAAQKAWQDARRKSLDGTLDEDAAVAAEAAAQEKMLEARDHRKAWIDYRDQVAKQAAQFQQEPNLEMLAWFDRNSRYEKDAAFKADADAAAIDLEHKQGLDPRKPQFWKKLDEKLSEGRRMSANGRTTPTPQASPGSRGGGGKKNAASHNESTLMRSVGLDPEDAMHLAEFRENYNRVRKVLAA